MSEDGIEKGFSNVTGKWIYAIGVIDHLRFIQCITDSGHPGDVPLDTISAINWPAVHTYS
ncbi:MAG: hypothetical protein ACJAWP_000818 [Porticoccus sp.]|jgi:hypothetical protein